MQNNITNKSACSYFIIGGLRPEQDGSRCGARAAECGAMVSRRQRGGWLAGRVGAVVVVSATSVAASAGWGRPPLVPTKFGWGWRCRGGVGVGGPLGGGGWGWRRLVAAAVAAADSAS